jgi:hypothetical protein
LKFPGWTVAASVNQNADAYFASRATDGDPATGWAYGGCDQGEGACMCRLGVGHCGARTQDANCGCPNLADPTSLPRLAVLLAKPETIDSVVLVSSAPGGIAGYHLTGGTLWYTTDGDLTTETSPQWSQPRIYPGRGCLSGHNTREAAKGLTLEECQAQCAALDFCVSIDWYSDETDSQNCHFSDAKAEKAGDFTSTANCNYWEVTQAPAALPLCTTAHPM